MLQILPRFGAKLTQISVRNPLKAFIVTIFILHFKQGFVEYRELATNK